MRTLAFPNAWAIREVNPVPGAPLPVMGLLAYCDEQPVLNVMAFSVATGPTLAET